MKHLKLFNESRVSKMKKIQKKKEKLEKLDLNKLTKVTKVTNDSVLFDNGLELSSYHSTDCCEHHWVEFSAVGINDFDDLEFDLSTDKFFNRIPDYGIELVPVKGWSVRIPGYGNNNGYYSDKLDLTLSDGRVFDITDCQEVTD